MEELLLKSDLILKKYLAFAAVFCGKSNLYGYKRSILSVISLSVAVVIIYNLWFP